jgi:hypothetical protein
VKKEGGGCLVRSHDAFCNSVSLRAADKRVQDLESGPKSALDSISCGLSRWSIHHDGFVEATNYGCGFQLLVTRSSHLLDLDPRSR